MFCQYFRYVIKSNTSEKKDHIITNFITVGQENFKQWLIPETKLKIQNSLQRSNGPQSSKVLQHDEQNMQTLAHQLTEP